jgi:hypothetical protein
MALLGDILQALDRVKGWKEMQAAPARIDALEKRVAQLEQALAAKPSGETCPKCNTASLRFMHEGPASGPLRTAGVKRRELACTDVACGYRTERLFGPDGSPFSLGKN